MDQNLILDLRTSPEEAADKETLREIVAKQIGVPTNTIQLEHLKRSIDARQASVKINLRLKVYVNEAIPARKKFIPNYPDVSKADPIIIIGAGPAGLFAALKAIEAGKRPIVLERGKNVTDRRLDLANITKRHLVNPDSNYCFGEGGAGTYSDGKLYTRSKKRGDVNRVLQILVDHGADPDILVDAHPHIGTNRLPAIIASIRETIETQGGKIHFNTKVIDLVIEHQAIKGVVCAGNICFDGSEVILATGHSARDIFHLLNQKGIAMEAKPFAVGIRVEHPQKLIDAIQYHCESRGDFLPAASYGLVTQVKNKGVYSFCMCPGGVIAPCATEQQQVVTNGWSPSSRKGRYANSGIVVEVAPHLNKQYANKGALAGIYFQETLENLAWKYGGETQKAPAQRLVDFVEGKHSNILPKTSYLPGVTSVKLQDFLPKDIEQALRNGFVQFGKKMKGYLTNEAIVLAVESRTSSPVKIPRDYQTLQHPNIKGLFPCGEGAGYAGGIVSAAIDGERCATAAVNCS